MVKRNEDLGGSLMGALFKAFLVSWELECLGHLGEWLSSAFG